MRAKFAMLAIQKVWRYCLVVVFLMVLGCTGGSRTPSPPVATLEAPMFSEPYIDIDEWRDKPVRHRYVHGGFRNTDTRFSYYFPPKDQYEGRFFQYITPVPMHETLSQDASGEDDKIGFAIAGGAYFIETNGGGQGSWVWRETVSALDRQTGGKFGRTLALDVPGCGEKRGRDTKDIAFGAIVDELIADVEEARMTDVVLVGHSQAGTAMAHMAENRPDLFRRVIYVSCSIPLPGQNVMDMIGDGVHGSDENTVGWPVDFKATSAQERAEIMFCNDMDEIKTADFMTRLGSDRWPPDAYAATNWQLSQLDKVPATYVLCLRDNILPVPWQETFAGRFHAEKIVRIDAGHQVMNTRPHALAEVLHWEAGRA